MIIIGNALKNTLIFLLDMYMLHQKWHPGMGGGGGEISMANPVTSIFSLSEALAFEVQHFQGFIITDTDSM